MKIAFGESTLDNGIRVATAAMPQVGSVAIGVWVGVGGRYEPKGLSGMSHFIEHLLFKGTKTRSALDISQAIEGRGGYFNAFTQEESTCYYARVAFPHLADVFDILAEMYLRPRFQRGDIDKERGVIIEEIMMYRDRPQSLVEDMLQEMLWSNHALGRALIGTPETIRDVSRRQILTFKESRYVPRNTVISFAGQLEHEACVQRVARALGRLQRRRKPAFSRVTRKTRQQRLSITDKNVEQSHVALGVRLFGRHDRRRYALKILSVLLGENMSSRLFQIVREEHGLAYSVHSNIQLFEETGVLAIQAGLDQQRTDKALSLIVNELVKLKKRRVAQSELRRAKDYITGQLRLSLEGTSSQMMWIGENLIAYGRFIQPETVIARLERVTAEDVQRVAEDVLRANRVSVAMIVPEGVRGLEKATHRQLNRL